MQTKALHFALTSTIVGLVPGVSVAAQGAAEPPPRQLVMRGMEEHPATFSGIKSVVSLRDGRLVVADPVEGRIALLDFRDGSGRALSREGGGPQEFQSPGGVYRARGGQVAVYDQGLRRFLLVASSGEVSGVRGVASSLSGTTVSQSGQDQAVPDTLGNLFMVKKSMLGPLPETVPVTRVSADGAQVTLGNLRQPRMVEVDNGQPNVILRELVNFSPVDIWAVSPDGWLATVSASPYQVRWYPPDGNAVIGPALAVVPLPVTEADRSTIEHARAANGPPVQIGLSGRRASPAPRKSEPRFAEFKPPFPDQIPVIDAGGRLWIRRHAAAGVRGTVYDVVDRRGRRTERFLLPPDTRLVGADAAWLYGVRQDNDDLLHLFRVAAP